MVSGAASLDSEVSKDGGTFTDCTNEASELATSSGMYTLALTSTEMNADIVATITKTGTAGAKTSPNVMYTVTRQLVDLAFPNTSGRGMDVDASGGVEVGAFQTGAITAAAFTAGAIDAAAIAADAIGASELADGAITAATFASGAIDAAALAADAVAEIRSAVNGTADSGTTTTMVDAARTEADTDYFKGMIILFTSGNIAGQARLITGFTPASDTVTFAPATTQAVGTNTYEILPSARVDLGLWLGSAPNALISGRVDVSLGASQTGAIVAAAFAAGAIDAAAIGTGAIDADAIAADAITAAKIATDAITAAKIAADAIGASELATDAINEIADGLMTRASSNWEASGWVYWDEEREDAIVRYGEFKPKVPSRKLTGVLRQQAICRSLYLLSRETIDAFRTTDLKVVFEQSDWHQSLGNKVDWKQAYSRERTVQRSLGMAEAAFMLAAADLRVPLYGIGAREAKQEFGAVRKDSAARFLAEEYPRFTIQEVVTKEGYSADLLYGSAKDGFFVMFDTLFEQHVPHHVSDSIVVAKVMANRLRVTDELGD